MSTNNNNGGDSRFVVTTGLPEDRADYRRRYPVCEESDLPAWKRELLGYAKELGADRKTQVALKQYLTIQFGPAVAAAGTWAAKHPNGTTELVRQLAEEQARFVASYEKQRLPESTVVLGPSDVNQETLRIIWQELSERLFERESAQLTLKPGERLIVNGVKVALALLQAELISQAADLHFGPRIVVFGCTVATAYGLSKAYQMVARPVVQALSGLTQPEVPGAVGPRNGRAAFWVELLVSAPGLLAMVVCGAILDAAMIVAATAKDVWGNPNPDAISHGLALGIAMLFSGMLGLTSLFAAQKDSGIADIRKRAEERVAEVRANVADEAAKPLLTEQQILIMREQEAQLFAASDGVWARVEYSLYGVYVGLPGEVIAHFLNGGSENPGACGGRPAIPAPAIS